MAVANDDLADARDLGSAASGSDTSVTDVFDATVEPQEDSSICQQTVWYRWTCPADGYYVFDTLGSWRLDVDQDLDTLLWAFVGTAYAAGPDRIAELAFNDDTSTSLNSRLGFTATAGKAYSIRVGTYIGAGLVHGRVTLNWAPGTPPPPEEEDPITVAPTLQLVILDQPDVPVTASVALHLVVPGTVSVTFDRSELPPGVTATVSPAVPGDFDTDTVFVVTFTADPSTPVGYYQPFLRFTVGTFSATAGFLVWVGPVDPVTGQPKMPPPVTRTALYDIAVQTDGLPNSGLRDFTGDRNAPTYDGGQIACGTVVHGNDPVVWWTDNTPSDAAAGDYLGPNPQNLSFGFVHKKVAVAHVHDGVVEFLGTPFFSNFGGSPPDPPSTMRGYLGGAAQYHWDGTVRTKGPVMHVAYGENGGEVVDVDLPSARVVSDGTHLYCVALVKVVSEYDRFPLHTEGPFANSGPRPPGWAGQDWSLLDSLAQLSNFPDPWNANGIGEAGTRLWAQVPEHPEMIDLVNGGATGGIEQWDTEYGGPTQWLLACRRHEGGTAWSDWGSDVPRTLNCGATYDNWTYLIRGTGLIGYDYSGTPANVMVTVSYNVFGATVNGSAQWGGACASAAEPGVVHGQWQEYGTAHAPFVYGYGSGALNQVGIAHGYQTTDGFMYTVRFTGPGRVTDRTVVWSWQIDSFDPGFPSELYTDPAPQRVFDRSVMVNDGGTPLLSLGWGLAPGGQYYQIIHAVTGATINQNLPGQAWETSPTKAADVAQPGPDGIPAEEMDTSGIMGRPPTHLRWNAATQLYWTTSSHADGGQDGLEFHPAQPNPPVVRVVSLSPDGRVWRPLRRRGVNVHRAGWYDRLLWQFGLGGETFPASGALVLGIDDDDRGNVYLLDGAQYNRDNYALWAWNPCPPPGGPFDEHAWQQMFFGNLAVGSGQNFVPPIPNENFSYNDTPRTVDAGVKVGNSVYVILRERGHPNDRGWDTDYDPRDRRVGGEYRVYRFDVRPNIDTVSCPIILAKPEFDAVPVLDGVSFRPASPAGAVEATVTVTVGDTVLSFDHVSFRPASPPPPP